MKTTYREAMREAIRDAMQRDDRVFLMGEDVGRYGGCYAVSLGLLEEFGPERIRDTPLSESAFVGAGIGAALGGMRPIVEIMTVNFSLLALDQIVNNAATLSHMSGGQLNVPLVIRMTTGAGRQLAAQHSHSLEGWYAHVPGLRVVAPATLEDARGMLWTALADPDPVLIFEHGLLYALEGELDDARRADRSRSRRGPPYRDGISPSSPTAARVGTALGCSRAARGRRRRRRGRRPANSAPARHGHDRRIGVAHASRGRGRRRLAVREPLRRGQRPHHRARLLRPRRTGRAGLQRGGADPVRPPARAGGACRRSRTVVAEARQVVAGG